MKLSRTSLVPLAVVLALSFAGAARADEAKPAPEKEKPKALHAVFDKANPESVEDLKAIERQVKEVLQKVVPCTVCVQVGQASGSGVIVSEDGIILTAGHVSGKPGQDVTVIMPDGKKLKGKTLGANQGIDSGMIKISEEGKYPHAEMGKASDLKKGTWCISVGHPGGFKPGRTPVVRVGRLLDVETTLLRSDCALVGGDSGGPLFDMHGRVVGIHSRIGPTITYNIHVPVDTYVETWDRLVKGESWGGRVPGLGLRGANDPYFGFQLDQDGKKCKVIDIVKDSPAEKAGLKSDDIIMKFDGKAVEDVDQVRGQIRKKKPGDEVAIEIQRGDETKTLKVVVGKRPQ